MFTRDLATVAITEKLAKCVSHSLQEKYMAKSLQHQDKLLKKAKQEARNIKMRKFVSWFLEIVVALVLATIVSMGFCYSVPVQDDSMKSTIENGDRVLVNRISYKVTGIKHGDLIVYKDQDVQDAQTHIRRVIGLPGETVQIKDGNILINGETYVDDGAFPTIIDAGLAESKITLGKNEYFVLGDNRNDSEDSRFATVGNIPKDDIIGKAWFIVSPIGHFGFIK